MNLPSRKPDKVFLNYIKYWKELDHYVLVIDLKDNEEVVLAVKDELKDDILDDDSLFSLIKAMLVKYAIRQ